MQTDVQLYHEARQGSELAFRTLYARHERPLYAYILRQCGRPEEAEEIFHETLLTLLRGSAIEIGPAGLTPWLFKVAHNRCLNRIRSRQREGRALTLYSQEQAVQQGETSETERPLAALEESARELRKPLREVYELRRQGRSYEDIAAELQLPVGTVKSRMHKLIGELKKGMEKWTAK